MGKVKANWSRKVIVILLCMLLIAAGIFEMHDTAHAELVLVDQAGTPTSTIKSAAYANGITVVVGNNGCIQTSSDGTTWTTQNSGISTNLYGVTYGNSTFVAVGDSGVILTSADGVTWTSQSSGTANAIYCIAYGNNEFVAMGSGYAGKSTDGKTWTQISYFLSSAKYDYTGAPQTFKAPTDASYTVQLWGAGGNTYYGFGGGGVAGRAGYATGSLPLTAGQTVYVYVGSTGYCTSSYDCTNGGWNGGGGSIYLGYGGGGATDVRTVNGAWNNSDSLASRVIVAGGGGSARGGVGGYGGGLSGGYGLAGGKQVSAPGTQTTGYALGQGQNNTWYAGGCGAGGAGGGYYGGYANSGSDSGGGGGSSYIGGVVNGSTIAGNAVMPSTTGGTETGHGGNGYAIISWNSADFLKIVYGNSMFAALDRNGGLYTSTDGTSWNLVDTEKGLLNIKYVNNAFYGVGQGGMLKTSSNVSSWTQLTSNTTNDLYDIAYGNNMYVAVGANDEILASRNGTTWKQQNIDTTANLYSVAYTTNGKFTAAGDSCLLLTIGDKTPPVMSISESNTNPINTAATVIANITDDNDFTSYWSTDSNAKASGTQFTGSFSAENNGTYYVYAVDSFGNETEQSITISNIDRTPPVITLNKSDDPAQSLVVHVTVTDNYNRGTNIFYYSTENIKTLDDVSFYYAASGTDSFTVGSNGTYHVLTQDAAGNYTQASITITNIDTDPPSISLTPSTTDLTRKLSVNAAITDKNTFKSYWSTNSSAGASGTEFTDSFDVTANGTYYVYAVDVAGNGTTKSITISNINTAPEITLTSNESSPTNKPVTITASIKSMLTYKSYWSTNKDAKDTGTQFTGNFDATSNGTYYVYAVDTDNKSDISSITVSKIDTTPPDVTISTSTSNYTNQPITVSIATSDANSVATYWSTSESAGTSGTQFNGSFTEKANGTYYIYAVDAAGNGVTKSITINNIDTVAPTLNLVESPLSPSQYVTVTANASDDSHVTTYWSTSPTAGITGKQFSGSFDAASNGTYYITAVDAAGNTASATITVSNINIKDDKGNTGTGTQPTDKTGSNSNVPIVATADPTVFKVVVPLSLPADVDRYGKVTVADNAAITNESSYGCIQVNQITAIGTNSWSLSDYSLDFGSMSVGAKQFGFTMNNNIADNSTGLINCSNIGVININTSAPISYMIKMPPQPGNLDNQTICNVVMVIDWYK